MNQTTILGWEFGVHKMSRSIKEMEKGDYVKVGGRYEKIESINGVGSNGSLAKPSKGGFSVTTESSRTIDMWQAQSYHKADDIKE